MRVCSEYWQISIAYGYKRAIRRDRKILGTGIRGNTGNKFSIYCSSEFLNPVIIFSNFTFKILMLMGSWIKMANNYKPAVGEELFATFSDWGGNIGTLYKCTEVTDKGFTVVSTRNIHSTEIRNIPETEQKEFIIPYSFIPIINLHREFKMGRE